MENQLSPEQFRIGAALDDEELLEKIKDNLDPTKLVDERLRRIAAIIKHEGNSIENIYKYDKQLAVYAMQLCNAIAKHKIKNKEARNDNRNKDA